MNNKQHNNNMKNRQRGRNNGKPRPGGGGGGGGGPNRSFDGNNNGRIRGNAQQLMEKFLAMARDASSSGDRVLAENYFQHADHYYRVLNARFEQQQNGQNPQNNGQQRPYQGGNDQGGNDRDDGDYQGQGDNGGNYQQPQYQPQNQQPQYQPQNQQPQQYAQPQHQPQQPSHQPQQQQPQPQPQQQPVQAQQDADIGLPPGILGIAPEASPPAPQGEQGGSEQGASEPGVARNQGRRRRGPPRERTVADAGAGE